MLSLVVLTAGALLTTSQRWLPPAPQPLITVTVAIEDGITRTPLYGDVRVDGRLVASNVGTYIVRVPADRQLYRIQVQVPGCDLWEMGVRSPHVRAYTIEQPARLRCALRESV